MPGLHFSNRTTSNHVVDMQLNEEKNEEKNFNANQYRIFSITYGAFFSLTGICLTTIEPFKACKFSLSLYMNSTLSVKCKKLLIYGYVESLCIIFSWDEFTICKSINNMP